MVGAGILQVVLWCMLMLVCVAGSSKGKDCKLGFEPASGEWPFWVDEDNLTESQYHSTCETRLPDSQSSALLPYFLFMAFCLVCYLLANLGVAFSFLNHFAFSHARISDNSFESAFVVIFAAFEANLLTKFAQGEGAAQEVKRAAMFISLGWLCPVLIVHVAITFVHGVEWGELGNAIFPAGTVAAFAFILAVITAIAKLLMFTILQTTRKQTVIEDRPEFAHTLLICGEQWKLNRAVPAGFDSGLPVASPTRARLRTRRPEEVDQDGVNSEADPAELAQEGYGEEGYAGEYYGEEGEYYDGEPTADEGYGDEAIAAAEETLTAVCLRRALFMMPDGRQGVFVALPTSEDQPVPFLFVEAGEVKPIRNRFSRKNAQVSFTFSSADVGGLDVDFVQTNVYNDPEAAWRQLEPLDGGGEGEEYGAEQDYGGYEKEEDVQEAPVQQEAPDYSLMTPRTLAAQRL